MEIHRYEKFWFGLGLLLIVAFIGTITYGAVGAGVSMVSDDGGTVDPDSIGEYEIELDNGESTTFAELQDAQATEVDDGEYAIAVRAIQFAFLPGTGQAMQVPEDSEVTFYITSPDVIHGFNLVGTNVNTMVIPGQMAEITVDFGSYDDVEEYGIVCNEFCGAGHEVMEGNLEVIPEGHEEYEWGEDE